MHSKELYEEVLGLEWPWRVVGVDLSPAEREVRIEIENVEKRPACPICGVEGVRTTSPKTD